MLSSGVTPLTTQTQHSDGAGAGGTSASAASGVGVTIGLCYQGNPEEGTPTRRVCGPQRSSSRLGPCARPRLTGQKQLTEPASASWGSGAAAALPARGQTGSRLKAKHNRQGGD